MALLRFESGPRHGEGIPLEKDKTVVGRHQSCDCVIGHPIVSRKHFCLERNGGRFFLVDLGSGNGTLVNGAPVTWIEVADGDKIQVGPFTMIFQSSDDPIRMSSGTGDEAIRAFDENHERSYPSEYLAGIEHFNARRYYDAHEVWEEIWLRSEGDTKTFYQMLIQAAVGLHHYERGNFRGGRGMHKNVNEKLQRLPSQFMSLDLADFSLQFNGFFSPLIEDGNETVPPDPGMRLRIMLVDVDGDD